MSADSRRSVSMPALAVTLPGWGYLVALAAWFALSRLHGDTPGYFGVATSLALYAFAPLPLVLLVAALRRSRALILGSLAGAALFAALWGGLFIPRPPSASAAGASVTVMTFNGLGRNTDPDAFTAAIRDENPDIVALQELNPEQARALDAAFATIYPYRILEPRLGVRGMGTLSRYPLRRLPDAFHSEWRCANQTLAVDVGGREVHFVNFHLLPYPEDLRDATALTRSFVGREREADSLAAWARSRPDGTPVLLAGDANASSTNRTWRILTRELHDAWREAGFGLGHTFPNRAAAGHGGIRRLGFEPPSWLVRIDYVFHSREWRAVRARTAASAGGSDHRGVIAELVLNDPS